MRGYGRQPLPSNYVQPRYSQPVGGSQYASGSWSQPQYSQSNTDGGYSQHFLGAENMHRQTSGGSQPILGQYSRGSLMGSSQISVRSLPDSYNYGHNGGSSQLSKTLVGGGRPVTLGDRLRAGRGMWDGLSRGGRLPVMTRTPAGWVNPSASSGRDSCGSRPAFFVY